MAPEETVSEKTVAESTEEKAVETATENLTDEKLEATLKEAFEKPDDDTPEKIPDLKIGLDEKGEITEPSTEEKPPEGEKQGETKTETEEKTDEGESELSEEEMLKQSGLGDFKTLADVGKSYTDLRQKYGDQLQPLLWAQKHAPHLLGKFYTDIGRAIVGEKDLPKVESPLKGRINPNTNEPYTDEEIQQAEEFFDAMAAKRGYIKADHLEEREKKSRYDNDVKEANLNIKHLEKQWKEKVEAIGLTWEDENNPTNSVIGKMSNYLAGFGVTGETPHLITPQNLANALNAVLLQNPDAISLIAANAKASGAQEQIEKTGKAQTLPTAATKLHAEPGDLERRLDSMPLDQAGKVIVELIKKHGRMKAPLF